MSIHLSRRALLAGASATGLLFLPSGPATAAAHSGSAAPRDDWRARLRDLEQAYDGRIGAFAVDTATGRSVSHRGNESFPLLSTFKVLASAAVLDRARSCDPGLMDRVIHWAEADVVANSPVTSQHVADGLTVAQLCEAAIGVSDNTAGNLLLNQLGGPGGIARYARSIGDPITHLDRWETELNNWAPGETRDTTTPAAMGNDLRALTVGRALHPDDRARLIGWLRAATTGGTRIRAGLPADWTIGDKTGSSSSYGAANDIAIAQPPSAAPLIIAIYTNRLAAAAPYDNSVIADTATILARALGRL